MRCIFTLRPTAIILFFATAAGCGDPTPSKLDQGSTGGSSETGESSSSEDSSSQSTGSDEQSTPESSSSAPKTDSSSTATSDAPESSSDTTSSGPDSGESSNTSSDQAPLPKIRIQVKPGAELCGLANDMSTTFKQGFTSKQKIHIEESIIETGELKLSGTLHQGSKQTSFEAELSNFKLREQPSGTNAFIADQQSGELEDGTPFHLGLALSQWPNEEIPTYTLDDWTKLPPNETYNSLQISASTPLDVLDGNKRAMFGACTFPEREPEIFAFEFSDGDRIEFVTKTRLLTNRRQYQRGLLLNAKGSFRGIDFDVDAWEMLVYAAREYALSPRRPELAVQFPEKDGICGLWLAPQNPDGDKAPYTAFVLNCDHEKIDTVEPSEWTIPPRFGKDWSAPGDP